MTPDPFQAGRMAAVDDLGNQLQQVRRLLTERAPAWTGGSGLAGSGFRLLAQLVVNGPQPVGALARRYRLDRTTVSRQLSDLLRDGLIDQAPDPEDRRVQISVATRLGRERFREARLRRAGILGELVADWSDEDLQTLISLLARLTRDWAMPFGALEAPENPLG